MRKIDNKGFVLIETLIVSVFVGVTLIILFIQLRNITTSYDRSFSYNTTNGLYGARKVRDYLFTRNYAAMKNEVLSIKNGYLDITSCDLGYYTVTGEDSVASKQYCNLLYNQLNIEKIILSLEDLTNVKYNIAKNAGTENIPQKMVDFVDYINYGGIASTCRIIIAYKDETYASIIIK